MDTKSKAAYRCAPRRVDQSVVPSRLLQGSFCLLLLLLFAGVLSAGETAAGNKGVGRRAARAAWETLLLTGSGRANRFCVSSAPFVGAAGTGMSFAAARRGRHGQGAGKRLLAGTGAVLCAGILGILWRAARKLRSLRQRLEENERRFSLVVEHSNDGILIVRDGFILYANQPLIHMTGLSKKEVAGRHFSLLIAPAAKDRFFNEYYSRTRLKNVADVYETALVSRDSGAVPVELRIYSCRYGSGAAELHVVRDIAERTARAEEKSRFVSFIDKNPQPVVEVNPDGSVCYANETARRHFPRLMSEGTADAFLEDFYRQAAILKTGGKEVCSREIRANGRWYQREFCYSKETGRFRIYGFDITERKRAEESLLQSEEKYRTLFETIGQGIICHGADGKVLAANPAAERILGLPMQRMIYKNCEEVFRHAVREDGTKMAAENLPPVAAAETGRDIKDAVIGIHTEAGPRWLSVSALPQRAPGAQAPGQVYAVFSDITAKRRTEKELLDSGVRYRRLFEGARDGIIITDGKTGDIIDVNPWLTELLGVPRQELCGRKLWDVTAFKEIVPHRAAFIEMLLEEYVRRDGVRVLDRDGRLRDAEFTGTIYTVDGRHVMQCGLRDVSERKKAEDQVKYLSFHDKVTGLYNRTYAEEELQRVDTERSLPVSIIMGDVNNLKLVNDAFGHSRGDRLLIRIAGILRAACRNGDIVARWGGDEFMVLLPKTDEKTAAEIVRRVQRECASSGTRPGDPVIALGVATKEHAVRDISEVLREAEDRMCRHKSIESRSRQNAILSSLLRTLRERGLESVQHTQRLKRLAVELGREAGLSDGALEELSLLSVLHDVGKIAVPDDILTKNGALTPQEWKIVRKHSEAGYRIVQSFNALSHIAEAVLSHHERWDGAGYPRGLKGNEIPLIARIFSVAEAYDGMLHDKPYGRAVSRARAIEELAARAGTQFDPALAGLFIEKIEPLRIIAGKSVPAACAAAR